MISEKKNISVELAISWSDKSATYNDRYFIIKSNFWRDVYPARLDYQIKRAEINKPLTINYKAGEFLEDQYQQSNLKTIPKYKFNRDTRGMLPIIPAVGRFYPRGLIEGVAGCFKEDQRAFRMLNITENSLDIDLNHPLAKFPLQISATITDIFDGHRQNGGRCNDVVELLTNEGQGLQTLLESGSSDYFSAMPFTRLIENDDAEFYAKIEAKDPVDLTAIAELQEFYSPSLKDNMQVLDLMAGFNSYLPEGLKAHVIGLGVNEKELKDNTRLESYQQHDLNKEPVLPFKDQQFDTIMCSFAIEYMTQPFEVFKQVARILKPGGSFCIAFSDRFFKQKAISIWDDIHPFERMGVVLEYFRQTEGFSDLQCESIRGKIRHEEDPFISKTAYSCPMFMIKGTRL
jgi:SAM-dependent methyltransferase